MSLLAFSAFGAEKEGSVQYADSGEQERTPGKVVFTEKKATEPEMPQESSSPVGTSASTASGAPKVVAPTQRGTQGGNSDITSMPKPYIEPKSLYTRPPGPGVYAWRKNITCTVFWIGEEPTAKNPTPNHKSSWDGSWEQNFGGYDDPDPVNRVANHITRDFRPKGFIPRQNPFYVALPYNDCTGSRAHKPEARRVIPWFDKEFVRPGLSVCKGKWVQIFYKGKYCFAQWEDCGPFTTEDWSYVFGSSPPKTNENGGAGIDLSPAVRDFLGVRSGEKVHWRFVEFFRIPRGPWSKYGDNNPFVKRQPSANDLRVEEKRKELEAMKNKAARG